MSPFQNTKKKKHQYAAAAEDLKKQMELNQRELAKLEGMLECILDKPEPVSTIMFVN